MNNIFSLELSGIKKTFKGLDVPVLNNLNIKIRASERIAINGISGSGKSTLLHIMAGLDKPDLGKVVFDKKNFDSLDDNELSSLRNKHIGFIYQFHHLLKDFTVIENIMMPQMIRGFSVDSAIKKSELLIKKLGIKNRADHFPHQLSGGERQRVAIARAMITSPDIILADEPTGNLDHKNAKIVFDLFLELVTESKTAIIMVTHDISLAKRMDKIYHLTCGKLEAK